MQPGSTTTPCNGNWTTVACGIGTNEDSECDVGIFIVEVTVAQLAPNASCQYLEGAIFKRRSVASGTYEIYQSNSILVTGTCIGIFNVCTGKLNADQDRVFLSYFDSTEFRHFYKKYFMI